MPQTQFGIGEYISTGAVLVALIALIWQSRQTARQLRLQNFTAYTERYQQIMLNLPVAVESSDFALQSLGPDQKENTLRWLRAYLDLCSEEHYLNEKGLIDKDVWALWASGMRDSMRKPAYSEAWHIIQRDKYYSGEFASFMSLAATNMGSRSDQEHLQDDGA